MRAATPLDPAAAGRTRVAVGILLGMAAFACFACLDATAKLLNQGYPPLQVVWMRYVGHVLVALLMAGPTHLIHVWRSAAPVQQLLRGTFLFTGTACNFIALKYLQLAVTGALNFTIPLWIAALSVPLLGEKVGIRRWLAILVGFAGVLLVIRPGTGVVHWAMFLSLATALCAALYTLMTRKLAGRDGPATSQIYVAMVGAIMATPLLAFGWRTPEGADWLLVLLPGLFGGVGHAFLVAAHDRAEASIIAPFWYSQIIWMVLFGLVLFGDVPDIWTLAGAAVVLASGLYVWYRERQLGKRAERVSP
ncbi:MAG: DMT family transporter [Geminicoccaceae bacterium]